MSVGSYRLILWAAAVVTTVIAGLGWHHRSVLRTEVERTDASLSRVRARIAALSRHPERPLPAPTEVWRRMERTRLEAAAMGLESELRRLRRGRGKRRVRLTISTRRPMETVAAVELLERMLRDLPMEDVGLSVARNEVRLEGVPVTRR